LLERYPPPPIRLYMLCLYAHSIATLFSKSFSGDIYRGHDRRPAAGCNDEQHGSQHPSCMHLCVFVSATRRMCAWFLATCNTRAICSDKNALDSCRMQHPSLRSAYC
jgi:hypothetical protein